MNTRRRTPNRRAPSRSATLEDVLITPELARRPRRPPALAAENRGLVALARTMADAPQSLLPRLAEAALGLGTADTVGIRLVERAPDGALLLRWHAAAGQFAANLQGATPRDTSPCRVVFERGAPQLFADPGRFFSHVDGSDGPRIVECLVVPFHVLAQPAGTIWLLAHDTRRAFDAEDVRAVTSLAEFASAALDAAHALRVSATDLLEANAVIAGQNTTRAEFEARARLDRQRAADLVSASRKEFAAELRALGALHEMAMALRVAADPPAALEAVLDAVMVVQHAELGAVWRASPTPQLVAQRGFAGSSPESIAALSAKEPAMRRALRDGELVVVEDVATDRAYARSRALAAAAGYAAVCATPLVTRQGEVLGVAATYFRHPHRPSERECRMTSLHSRHAAEVVARMLTDAALRTSEAARVDLLARAEEARALAEAANRAKDDFLATISHELRGPLAATELWLHVLRTGGPSEQARAVDAIEQSTRRQHRLIADLLDVARALAGKLRLELELVDLALVIETTLDDLAAEADARSVRVVLVAPSDAIHVRGDIDRLQQVVANLVSNAIRFSTTGGRVEVRLWRDGERAHFAVQDEGRGISPAFLPHVFAAFRQEDASTTRAHGGLGLGLAIARQIVELHGGAIRAESPGEGRGATFTVTLPAAGAAPASEPRATHAANRPAQVLAGLRVLVVEDDVTLRAAFTMVLEQHGAQVTTAGAAGAALDAFQRVQPDVLLCDLAMPGEDGFELIRKVRALEGTSDRHTPAAALTGHARDEDRAQSLRAGFQEHVTKPFSATTLVAVVLRLAGRDTKPGG